MCMCGGGGGGGPGGPRFIPLGPPRPRRPRMSGYGHVRPMPLLQKSEKNTFFISKFIKMFRHELRALDKKDSRACRQDLMGLNHFVQCQICMNAIFPSMQYLDKCIICFNAKFE